MRCKVQSNLDILRLLHSPGQRFVSGLGEEEGEEATEQPGPGEHGHGEPGEGGEEAQLGDVRGEDGAQPAHHGAHTHTETPDPGGEQFPRVEVGRPETRRGSELAEEKEDGGDLGVGDQAGDEAGEASDEK